MTAYQTKTKKLGGTSYSELIKKARRIFHDIESQSRRKPYIRSAYFNKEKIFFDLFWTHLAVKSPGDRMRRLKFFACAIELIQKSKNEPKITNHPHSKNTQLYRFLGTTKNNESFYVQIKEDRRTKQKHLMSIFPLE